jgi:ribosomal protein S27E
MKCPNTQCNFEFTQPPGRSLSNCPLCGELLVKPAVGGKCESLADVLARVKEEPVKKSL